MSFASPTNSAAKLTGYREWTDRLLELLAEAAAGRVVGMSQIKAMAGALNLMRARPVDAAKAPAKVKDHGWAAIVAQVIDPERVRPAAKP